MSEIKKKVLVLFCGGTMFMRKNAKGSLTVMDKEEAMKSLLQLEPRIHEWADISVEYVDNIDSTNIVPTHWEQMTNIIANNYEEYDGFVITHGTDTMAYTASALTFSLQKLGKPVILTGSQIPGDFLESDARMNFINAVRIALSDLCGVYIVFHEKIVLGARSSKVSESKLNAFDTKNAPDSGEIRVDIRFQKNIPRRTKNTLQPLSKFESNILVVTIAPGRNIESLIDALSAERTKGLIIRTYSSGNIPSEFLPVLEKAQEKRIPIVVTSQCLHGSTIMERYDVGHQALKLGVIQAYDMSIECAVTKFMWALANFSFGEISEVMQKSYVGEINTGGELYG